MAPSCPSSLQGSGLQGKRHAPRHAADPTRDVFLVRPHAVSHAARPDFYVENNMKILLWLVAIIFIIGLLVVFGFFSLIF